MPDRFTSTNTGALAHEVNTPPASSGLRRVHPLAAKKFLVGCWEPLRESAMEERCLDGRSARLFRQKDGLLGAPIGVNDPARAPSSGEPVWWMKSRFRIVVRPELNW